MRRSSVEKPVLRSPRPDWARWAARLGRACFCVLGGVFFWWLLGGVAQAETEPAPAPSLTSTLGSIVDSVVGEVTQPPATGIQPVDDLTSTVAVVLRGTESSSPLSHARSEPLPPQPAATPDPVAVAVSAPAPPAPPPPAPVHVLPVHRMASSDAAVVRAPVDSVPASQRVDPGVPAAPAPDAPIAASSAGAPSLDAQPAGMPPPTSQRLARLIPRDDVPTDVRVTRPDVFPD